MDLEPLFDLFVIFYTPFLVQETMAKFTRSYLVKMFRLWCTPNSRAW